MRPRRGDPRLLRRLTPSVRSSSNSGEPELLADVERLRQREVIDAAVEGAVEWGGRKSPLRAGSRP